MPLLTFLMTVIALLGIVAGVGIFILRRTGKRAELSPDQEETQRILNEAFGRNTRWGKAGGTESETHNHAETSSDSSSDSND